MPSTSSTPNGWRTASSAWDIVSLVERAAENIDAEKAQRIAEKMRKGKFDLDDLRDQLSQMEKIGGIGGMLGMLPGVAKMKAANPALYGKIMTAAFPAAGKLTKPAWLVFTILSAGLSYLIGPGIGLLSMVFLIVSLVYLADVRPAVREISGGNRW